MIHKLKLFFLVAVLSLSAFAQSHDGISDLINNENFSEADLQINTLIKKDPSDMLAWFNAGVSKYKQKEFSNAYNSFTKVAQSNSQLKDAALYYAALCSFNLGLTDEVSKSIKSISVKSTFYASGAELLMAQQTGEDPELSDAKQAYEDGDYEVCLQVVKDSLFIERSTGKEVYLKCKNELESEAQAEASPEGREKNSAKIVNKENEFSFYADLSSGYDNNVFLSATNPTAKATYEVALGGEFLYKSSFDIGVGFNYDVNDYVDLANEKTSYLNLYIPFAYYFSNSDIAIELYHTNEKDYQTDLFTQSGVNASYTQDFDLWSAVVTLDLSRKKPVSISYNFIEGNYSSLRGDIIFNDGEFKADFFLIGSSNKSEDIDLTGGVLPYAHNALETGLYLGYWVTPSFRPAVTYSITGKRYLNAIASGLERADRTSFLKVKLEYKVSRNLRTYLELQSLKNTSNFDNTQIVDKNYDQSLIKLGLLLNY